MTTPEPVPFSVPLRSLIVTALGSAFHAAKLTVPVAAGETAVLVPVAEVSPAEPTVVVPPDPPTAAPTPPPTAAAASASATAPAARRARPGRGNGDGAGCGGGACGGGACGGGDPNGGAEAVAHALAGGTPVGRPSWTRASTRSHHLAA